MRLNGVQEVAGSNPAGPIPIDDDVAFGLHARENAMKSLAQDPAKSDRRVNRAC